MQLLSIRTGLVKPNSRMLSAICRICFREWLRALREQGVRDPSAKYSMLRVGEVTTVSLQANRCIGDSLRELGFKYAQGG
jgi:hypothetical protein